jgi:hypothetical protein
MSLNLDLSGTNKWNRIFYQPFQGNPENRKIRAPLIEPFEFPFILQNHVLAIMISSSTAKASWRTAGYLTQTYPSVITGGQILLSESPTSGVDACTKRIGLNTIELVVFPKLANQYYLWFDFVPWLPKATLGLWQFIGNQFDATQEVLETIKVDILRVEAKVDEIRS